LYKGLPRGHSFVSSLEYIGFESRNSMHDWCFYIFFVANAFISPFNSQKMHIKSFCTQQHCYVSLKTLCPGGIRTRVFLRCTVLWTYQKRTW
jgi:hypothetical protein